MKILIFIMIFLFTGISYSKTISNTEFLFGEKIDRASLKNVKNTITGFEFPLDIDFSTNDIYITGNIFFGYTVYINPKFKNKIKRIALTDLSTKKKYIKDKIISQVTIDTAKGSIDSLSFIFYNYGNLSSGKWRLEMILSNNKIIFRTFIMQAGFSITKIKDPGPFYYEDGIFKKNSMIFVYGQYNKKTIQLGLYRSDDIGNMTGITGAVTDVRNGRFYNEVKLGTNIESGDYAILTEEEMNEKNILCRGFSIK